MRSNQAGIRLHLVLNKHSKYRCITGSLCLVLALQMAAYAKSDVKAAGMQQEVSFQYLVHLPFFSCNFELYIFLHSRFFDLPLISDIFLVSLQSDSGAQGELGQGCQTAQQQG